MNKKDLERVAINALAQTFEGMSLVHSDKYHGHGATVHRDIKPANR